MTLMLLRIALTNVLFISRLGFFFSYNNSSNNNNNINNDNSFVWKEKMKEQTKMSRNVLNGWSLINCYGDGTPNGRWTCICEDFCIASPYLIMIDGQIFEADVCAKKTHMRRYRKSILRIFSVFKSKKNEEKNAFLIFFFVFGGFTTINQ